MIHGIQNESTDIQNEHPSVTQKLEQELNEARERYLRLAADFDNRRKRTARESEISNGPWRPALAKT
jgi:molecular chaperone GrpE (heat shock protein)